MSESENNFSPAPAKDIEAWLRIVLADERQKHLREVMELKFLQQLATNEVAKIELARRLDALNHEATQLKRMQDTYLPRETYDARHHELEKEVQDLRDFKNNHLGRQTVLSVVVSTAVSLAFLIVNWLIKMR